MLMGSEIISDSSNGITIQVLVNLLELSVDGAFQKNDTFGKINVQ